MGWQLRVMMVLLLVMLTAVAGAAERVALVIGNGAYENTSRLVNPPNDARAMDALLKELGFETELKTDLNHDDFGLALRRFGQRLRGAKTALFYYAGHGIQVDGKNYLIPVSAKLKEKQDLKYEAFAMDGVLEDMEVASEVRLVFLDACRDNPLTRSLARGLSGTRSLVGTGLAPPSAASGTLISYATKDGATAEDGGLGRNSPYTAALLKHLKKGEDIRLVLGDVRAEVEQSTDGQQVPWEYGSLKGRFYMAGGVPESEETPPPPPPPPTPGKKTGHLQVMVSGGRGKVMMGSTVLGEVGDGEVVNRSGLAVGKVKVTVAGDGYEGWEREVEIRAGEWTQVVAELKKTAPPPPPTSETASSPVKSREEATKTGGYAKAWRDPVTGMEFVKIPKGCIRMGSPPSEKDRSSDEGPEHEVCVDTFWLGKYEVTNRQYRAFKPDHDSEKYKGLTLNGDDQPVVNINWNEATAYAQWLSGQGNGGFRLPTEAEWEYAARGGTKSSRYWGDDPKDACKHANVADRTAKAKWSNWTIHDCSDGYEVTAPVGRFAANPFGLYDMLGNVREWVSDWYGDKYYANSPRNNPQGPSGGSSRVDRGGSWADYPANVRSAIRFSYDPGYRFLYLGLRLSRTYP